jgi:hypothetical protein
MVRIVLAAIGVGVFLAAGTVEAGTPPDALSKEGKTKEVGRKATSLMKAFGKNTKVSTTANLAQEISTVLRHDWAEIFSSNESEHAQPRHSEDRSKAKSRHRFLPRRSIRLFSVDNAEVAAVDFSLYGRKRPSVIVPYWYTHVGARTLCNRKSAGQ